MSSLLWELINLIFWFKLCIKPAVCFVATGVDFVFFEVILKLDLFMNVGVVSDAILFLLVKVQ